MMDTGSPTSPTILGAFLRAPTGQTLWSFTVGPLANNVYQTPFGPVEDCMSCRCFKGHEDVRLDEAMLMGMIEQRSAK